MTRVSTALSLWWMLATGCGARVPRVEQPETAHPACFTFSYVAKGRLRSAHTCWESRAICAEAMQVVAKYGGRASVTSVGECEGE